MARENSHLDPRFVRRNLIAFSVEFLAFGVAMAFINYSVVLPKLLDDLGATSVFIGLASSSINIIWTGTQFFGGAAASHFKKIKNMMWLATLAGRPALMGYGLFLFLNGGRNPILLQWLLLLGILIMFGLDSFAGTAWYDISARTFPSSKRPGIMAAWGILNAVAGLFVAGAISQILGPNGPAFPNNYALLFLCSSAGFIISWIAWAVIKDPPQENGHSSEIIPIRRLPAIMLDLLKTDCNLRNAVLSKFSMGLAAMAVPFYVLFGINELALPPQTVALFITAQMIGTISGNFIMGWIGNKWGPGRNILFAMIIYSTAPLLAVFLGARGVLMTWQGFLYLWVYVCVSIIQNSSLLGASNYVMDIAPEGKIPVYMSTLNSLSSIGMFGPLLGGWLVTTFSYQFMFLFSLIFVGVTFYFASRLKRVSEIQAERKMEESQIGG